MSTGTYISAIGHAGLLVWLLAGWGLSSDPLDFEFSEVSIVSGEEFDAILRAGQPDAPSAEAPSLSAPEVAEETPPVATPEETPVSAPEAPANVTQPSVEDVPEVPTQPVPQAEVMETAPVEPQVPQVVTPPASTILDTSLRPKPRPAPRIAPEAVAAPEPDAVIAEDVAQATTETPDAVAETDPVENTTSPEEATTEVVTEAETPSGAPEVSLRPQSRPNRPAPQPETQDTDSSAEVAVEDAVAAALADALASGGASQPTEGVAGGALSDATLSSFLRQVGGCWNVGAASTGAMNTQVTLGFAMTPDGMVNAQSVELIGYSGGSQGDARVAFDVARRALLRCQNADGRTGYDLPADQYDQWQRVELTFNPDWMRNR